MHDCRDMDELHLCESWPGDDPAAMQFDFDVGDTAKGLDLAFGLTMAIVVSLMQTCHALREIGHTAVTLHYLGKAHVP